MEKKIELKPATGYVFACSGCGRPCGGILIATDEKCEFYRVFSKRSDAEQEAKQFGIADDHIMEVEIKQK